MPRSKCPRIATENLCRGPTISRHDFFLPRTMSVNLAVLVIGPQGLRRHRRKYVRKYANRMKSQITGRCHRQTTILSALPDFA